MSTSGRNGSSWYQRRLSHFLQLEQVLSECSGAGKICLINKAQFRPVSGSTEGKSSVLTTWDLPSGSGRESSSPKLWGTQDFQDFNRVTWQLTSVSAKLAYCTYNCQVHLPMLDELDQINQELVNGSSPGRQPDLQRVHACLQANNAFLRARLQATSVRATYLSQRAQAQVQTVSRTQLHRTDPILTSSRG